MYRRTSILNGSLLQSNPFPQITNAKITIPGTYNNTSCNLGLSNDILSKHVMLIGGT